jgi:hypothetical protein
MAKIIEEIIIVKLSKLVRDDEDATRLAGESLLASIEESIQHQFSDAIVVEVERN